MAISPRFATSTFRKEATSAYSALMTFADQLTVARAAAVPVVVVLFAWNFPNHDYWATAVFAVAMATDWVDGWWARRNDRTSDLGKILDPVADKLLVMAALIMLVGDVLPAWMVAAVIAREFLVTGSVSPPGARRVIRPRPRQARPGPGGGGRAGDLAGGAIDDPWPVGHARRGRAHMVSGPTTLTAHPDFFCGQQPA
jgi:hypothetical protein